jgi:catechol 2,3-dioxygenase-like lactoylglutathione lyase family enzyme
MWIPEPVPDVRAENHCSDTAPPQNSATSVFNSDLSVGTVEGIEDVLDRLRSHGAELVGELVRYENSYWLCYVRGPAGIIIELAEQIR